MGSSYRTDLRCAEPELELLAGKLTGTGAASPTVSEGCTGFTVAWVSTGVYDFTFDVPVKQVFPCEPSFWATTITDVDGWKVVFGAYNASTRKLRMSVVNQAQTLADLPAATGVNPVFLVKLTATRG